MIHRRSTTIGLAGAVLLLFTAVGSAQQPTRPGTRPPSSSPPRLAPLAETKLLMEGLTNANFLGLEKILRESTIEAENWNFARGQALLIAESANLLMLRPPRNTGQDVWMKTATDLRDAAAHLSRTVSSRDLERSRYALVSLANVCNSCHQTFRVTTRITPFEATKP